MACINGKDLHRWNPLFLVLCDSHGGESDPFGVANIKIMVLLQCAHNECVILNFAGKWILPKELVTHQ